MRTSSVQGHEKTRGEARWAWAKHANVVLPNKTNATRWEAAVGPMRGTGKTRRGVTLNKEYNSVSQKGISITEKVALS